MRPAAPPCLPMRCSRACAWATCPSGWLPGRRKPSTAPVTSTSPRTGRSLQLDGICLVAGLGGKDHRDGSLAYYFSEPVVCNDAKGVGPLVLAYTEMIARK